jgi:hypothetical protein
MELLLGYVICRELPRNDFSEGLLEIPKDDFTD